MPISILMPALSPTMTEGNLAKWSKKEGDTVKPGEVIAEIETDKATMEVEAVDEGKLAKILVPAGTQGVKVNQPIAILLAEGEKEIPPGFTANQNQTAKPGSPPSEGGVRGGVGRDVSQPLTGEARRQPSDPTPLSPPSRGGENM